MKWYRAIFVRRRTHCGEQVPRGAVSGASFMACTRYGISFIAEARCGRLRTVPVQYCTGYCTGAQSTSLGNRKRREL